MELAACITGFICWKNLKPSYWKVFPFYLLFIVIAEFTGWYLSSHHLFAYSKILYNYLIVPSEFLFMFYLFYHSLKEKYKITVLLLVFLFFSATIVEYVILKKTTWLWMSLSFAIGAISMLVLAVIFFLELLTSESIIHFAKQPFFWVCFGITLFYVGTFPYMSTISFLYKSNINLAWLLSWVFVLLNYIMYLFFIKAFLCFKKLHKYY